MTKNKQDGASEDLEVAPPSPKEVKPNSPDFRRTRVSARPDHRKKVQNFKQ